MTTYAMGLCLTCTYSGTHSSLILGVGPLGRDCCPDPSPSLLAPMIIILLMTRAAPRLVVFYLLWISLMNMRPLLRLTAAVNAQLIACRTSVLGYSPMISGINAHYDQEPVSTWI